MTLFEFDPSTNEFFSAYNKVFINYCDGTGHQGYRSQPIQFNGTDLHFRGTNNTLTIIDYLIKNMALDQASQVIFV